VVPSHLSLEVWPAVSQAGVAQLCGLGVLLIAADADRSTRRTAAASVLTIAAIWSYESVVVVLVPAVVAVQWLAAGRIDRRFTAMVGSSAAVAGLWTFFNWNTDREALSAVPDPRISTVAERKVRQRPGGDPHPDHAESCQREKHWIACAEDRGDRCLEDPGHPEVGDPVVVGGLEVGKVLGQLVGAGAVIWKPLGNGVTSELLDQGAVDSLAGKHQGDRLTAFGEHDQPEHERDDGGSEKSEVAGPNHVLGWRGHRRIVRSGRPRHGDPHP